MALQDFLNAQIFTSDAWRKQYKLIGLIAGLTLVYIIIGYYAQRQTHQLAELQKELQDQQYQQLTIHANLTNKTRQSQVFQQLQERGSQLKENTKPVIAIK